MAEEKSFREIQARAMERLRREGPRKERQISVEVEKSYQLFYPIKPMTPARPPVPPTAPGVRMTEEYYHRHRRKMREISPYGELSENNPNVLKFAAELGISVRRFINNVKTFQTSLDNYKKQE
jgi:glutamine synthetase